MSCTSRSGRYIEAANSRRLFCARGGDFRGRGIGFLEAISAAKLLTEPLDAAGCVDELLLPGEERVAGAADIDGDPRQRAARGERVAAGTVDVADLIFRMG